MRAHFGCEGAFFHGELGFGPFDVRGCVEGHVAALPVDGVPFSSGDEECAGAVEGEEGECVAVELPAYFVDGYFSSFEEVCDFHVGLEEVADGSDVCDHADGYGGDYVEGVDFEFGSSAGVFGDFFHDGFGVSDGGVHDPL